ncbi:uncharacterized protein LOC110019895 isoform X3 [Phalaenopsis equestris]|uniref:uncharacterized protein LOC110019895 isoform X3 n=1 Tax=Phalaenopsis equestris TaxID=78828 RepID=UPI0009E4C3D9|nr:uncharacterized protein LOC110019895 isoform X3 [Phalaenopsis equestris]
MVQLAEPLAEQTPPYVSSSVFKLFFFFSSIAASRMLKHKAIPLNLCFLISFFWSWLQPSTSKSLQISETMSTLSLALEVKRLQGDWDLQRHQMLLQISRHKMISHEMFFYLDLMPSYVVSLQLEELESQ